jgi:hypothetical protein
LFARPALVVEGDDPLGWARQVGDDETDAWIKLASVVGHDFNPSKKLVALLEFARTAGGLSWRRRPFYPTDRPSTDCARYRPP